MIEVTRNCGWRSARLTGGAGAATAVIAAMLIAATMAFVAVPATALADGGWVPMYRLYNPYSGEHFYTMQESERDNVAAAGWRYEGVGWVAPDAGEAVYRLYNPYAGDHHYTISETERDSLLKAGWQDEGAGWVSAGDVQLFREYNPNEQSHNHNYTTDKAEHDSLVASGWKDEGVAWYGVAAGYNDPESLGYDNLTGEFFFTGGASPTAIRGLSISSIKMEVTGDLTRYRGKPMGDSLWTFGVDDRTVYGYYVNNEFRQQSREEFAAMFGGLNFPQIVLQVNNGIIESAIESS